MATMNRTEQAAADRFSQLALELHDAPGVRETVGAVVEFALHAEDCACAGVTLAGRRGRAIVAAATDPAVECLYQLQIDTHDGPMLVALAGRTSVYVGDVAAETRWPAWRAKAAAVGFGSALHVPMTAGDQTVGVLSLFQREPYGFSADDEAVAHILARHASVAVANARQQETMVHAIDARKLVGQAMGILMERFDVTSDAAFAILKRYSQDSNTRLRDVAQQLVDTRHLPR